MHQFQDSETPARSCIYICRDNDHKHNNEKNPETRRSQVFIPLSGDKESALLVIAFYCFLKADVQVKHMAQSMVLIII